MVISGTGLSDGGVSRGGGGESRPGWLWLGLSEGLGLRSCEDGAPGSSADGWDDSAEREMPTSPEYRFVPHFTLMSSGRAQVTKRDNDC